MAGYWESTKLFSLLLRRRAGEENKIKNSWVEINAVQETKAKAMNRIKIKK